MKPKIILLTGNHHTPALELIRQLSTSSQKYKLIYLTTPSLLDTHLPKFSYFPHLKLIYHQSPKFDRRFLYKNISLPINLFISFINTFRILRQIRPSLIVSFGGFTSFPVVFIGRLLSIKSITHEQTMRLGLANWLNSIFVDYLCLSFEATNNIPFWAKNKIVITGNLLRHSLTKFSRSMFASQNINLPIIYVTGGSRGSQAINRLIWKILPKIISRYYVVHQLGNVDISTIPFSHPNYHPLSYLDAPDFGWLLAHASIVISRSGANTVQELALFKSPSILIPLVYGTNPEQVENAAWLRNQNPSTTIIIDQDHITSRKLLTAMNKFYLNRPSTHPDYKPNYSIKKLINSLFEN